MPIENELREAVYKHISEMLDNPDKYDIYPTTKCYGNLTSAILKIFEKYRLSEDETLKERLRLAVIGFHRKKDDKWNLTKHWDDFVTYLWRAIKKRESHER